MFLLTLISFSSSRPNGRGEDIWALRGLPCGSVGYAGGCRRVQGPPVFQCRVLRCRGPCSRVSGLMRPGSAVVAAHATPYPAASSRCFWRSGPRVVPRYSWRTTLRGSVAVPQLSSEVGERPRDRNLISLVDTTEPPLRTMASADTRPSRPSLEVRNCRLTRAVLVVCVFRVVLGGGVFMPPNSAPGPRSDTR